MPAAEVRRPAFSAQLMAGFAMERGMRLADCLRDTGIEGAALADPGHEIRPAQELQLVRNLLAGLGQMPGLGLDLGQRYRLSSYGIWGFTLLSSPTFRSAAHLAVRYLDLSYAFVRFRLEAAGRDLMIFLDDGDVPAELRQFLIERDFAAWASAAWELRPGGFPAQSAEFRFARPDYGWRFDRLCGVKPRFGAPVNRLRLAAADLDTPLPQANPALARMCEEQCRQLLARRRVRSGFAAQIRDRLLVNPGDMPALDAVARELHLAPRSLRRRLDEEGTSFRALVDEVRQTLAEEMLLSGHMKLAEIAGRLGYTEPSAFIAAFRRWKGQAPGAFRAARGHPAAAGRG